MRAAGESSPRLTVVQMRGLMVGASEDKRPRLAAKLFVLARIVEGDFEHERASTRCGDERYLYSRE